MMTSISNIKAGKQGEEHVNAKVRLKGSQSTKEDDFEGIAHCVSLRITRETPAGSQSW